jgi:hypothetical protein
LRRAGATPDGGHRLSRAMTFAVNGNRRVRIERAGNEGYPVICIDELLVEPRKLIDLATEAVFIDVNSVYPGVRAPAPRGYEPMLLEAVAPVIEEVFGSPPVPELDLCAFSMVTTPPDRLRPAQRIPLYDGPEPSRLAWLHYLFDGDQGGTSFYRQRGTGLERVTPERTPDYQQQLRTEMASGPAPAGYASIETRGFERIHTVDCAFDRLVVYPGNALHSGDISRGTVFGENPRTGRLTINGFGFLRS